MAFRMPVGRRIVVTIVAFVLGFGLATEATAQTQPDSTLFTFSGQVLDASTSRPLIAAVIKVPELERLAYSQVDGTFEFEDFPAGTWTFIIEQVGYHTSDGRGTVAEGNGMVVHLRPDPVALAGFKVRARSERLITTRARAIPYRVKTLGPEVFSAAINTDPAHVMRMNANAPITPCGNNQREAMAPSCVWSRSGVVGPLAVIMDEVALMGGMEELSIYDAKDVHSMELIVEMMQLRVYTRRFIERLDRTEISLAPLAMVAPLPRN